MTKKIEVLIAGDASSLVSALKKGGSGLTSFSEKAKGSRSHLGVLSGAIAGVAAMASTYLVSGLKESVQAAEADQTAQAKLAQAFKNAHEPISQYADAIEEAKAKGRALGFGDQEVSSALAQMVTATHNGKLAVQALATEEDLARAKHMSLAAAGQMIVRAMSGSTRAAKAMGIQVQSVTTATDGLKKKSQFATLAQYEQAKAAAKLSDSQATARRTIAAVTAAVHGQASAFAKTGAGAAEVFKVQLEHLKAVAGTALIPVMTKVSTVLSRVVVWMTKNKSAVIQVGIAVGGAVVAFKAISAAMAVGRAAAEAYAVVSAAVESAMAAGGMISAAYSVALINLTAAEAEATLGQKLMAAGTVLLNAVMDANPVLLIVTGIVALGAALVVAYKKVGWFRDGVNTAFSVVKAVVGSVVGFVSSHWKLLVAIVAMPVAAVIELAKHFGTIEKAASAAWSAIKSGATAVYGALKGAVTSVVGFVGQIPEKVLGAVAGAATWLYNAGASIIHGLVNGAKAAWSAWTSLNTRIRTVVVNAASSAISWLRSAGQNVIHGLVAGAKAVWSGWTSITGQIRTAALNAVASAASWLVSAGENVIRGLVNGVKAVWGTISAKIGSIGSTVTSAIGNAGSWLYSAGQQIINGLISGIGSMIGSLFSSIESALGGLVSKAKHALGINSPSKVFAEIGSSIGEGLAKGIVESKHPYAALKTQIGNLLSAARDARSEIQSQISSTVSSLVASVVPDDPSNAVTVTSYITPQSILQGLQSQVSAMSQFRTVLTKLKKEGLSNSLLQQLISAGPVSGLAAAQQMEGDAGLISQLNRAENQLSGDASGIGALTASATFQGKSVGLATIQGIISGLNSKSSDLMAVMEKIAKEMIKTVKKVTKTHSPSKVFHEIGGFIAQGLENGIRAGTPAVARAASAMVSGAANPSSSNFGGGGVVAGSGVTFNGPVTIGSTGAANALADRLGFAMKFG